MSLLGHMLDALRSLPEETEGLNFVAYMQTLLLLCSNLNGSDEGHLELFDRMISSILHGLDLSCQVAMIFRGVQISSAVLFISGLFVSRTVGQFANDRRAESSSC